MGQQHRRSSLRVALSNLRGPLPLGKKIRLALKNNWTKLRRRQSCCGNPCQPGC